jgi:hypothetical protein
MLKRTLGTAAFCTWLLAANSLLAHHSLAGVYQMDKTMELSGEAVDVKFTNPHGSMGIAVKNADGTTTKWVMTLGSATALAQRGIGKTGPNAIRTGDKIKFKFVPAKDGSPLGFLQSVTMPDGRVIQVSGGGANE